MDQTVQTGSEIVREPYLLVSHITCYVGDDGVRYLDPLWFRDLRAHLPYLADLTLAAPRIDSAAPAGYLALTSCPEMERLKFVDLPNPRSLIEGILLAPATASRLWAAIRRARVVHSGVAGWPLPAAWFTSPIALLCRRFSLIVVESAFWRIPPGGATSLSKRLRERFSEVANRWCVNRADLAIFTQHEYLESLRTRNRSAAHVIHASWIDADNVLSAPLARDRWRDKLRPPSGPLKLIFIGRLTSAKGLDLLLNAIPELERTVHGPLQLDILGQGELASRCEAAARQQGRRVAVRTLGSVEYGAAFFALLNDYHAVLVPSVSDEQPRIVYDAYSQAIPVIASATAGLRDCISDGLTGRLLPPGDLQAWVAEISELTRDARHLEGMGLSALERARSLTHHQMHEQRRVLLLEALSASHAPMAHQA